MKKIDLHIHTIPTVSDRDFEFSLDKLCGYVANAHIDAIAITNHNFFDIAQFKTIRAALNTIKVFPGIEVSLETGHVLIIDDSENVDSFSEKTLLIAKKNLKRKDFLTVDELESIFNNLDKLLVIPHYKKKPGIRGAEFNRLEKYISAGEVDSAKKFIRTIKESSKITPVLFSDERFSDEMINYPIRQTYVDCGELTLNSLKASFRDKGKVALSQDNGNAIFQIFDDGQKLSTGLNIILGERSSGKTYTLNRISKMIGNPKFIEQFSLVQKNEDEDKKRFKDDVARERSLFAEAYLEPFKKVLNEALIIDINRNEKEIDLYIETLLQSAEDIEKEDEFSKTALYNETELVTSEDSGLDKLIGSVRHVIENIKYRSIIEKHLDKESLKRLACELIEVLWDNSYENKKKKFANSIIRDVKDRLNIHTSATQVEDVDFYKVTMESKTIEKFKEITRLLQKEMAISEKSVQEFRIVATKKKFANATDIKSSVDGLGKASLVDAFREYDDPYSYLLALKDNEALTPSEFYKYFVNIDYEILNRDSFPVSGGERSEFRLLQQIKDAQNHDILLIDEPESSFDNIFLKGEVNQIIKDISETMPVVVVTHNSTVGASIKPDYIVYASKEREDGKIVHRLYSGYPADRELISLEGKTTRNFDITMNSLEAGSTAYSERKAGYESIKD